jgi:membrane-associated phospholipid phosphatase
MGAGKVAVAGGAAFVVLAVLVATGAVRGIDRYAAEHWMPWNEPPRHALVQVRTVFVPETRWTLGGTLAALLTYPASPFVSALVVLVCALLLRRRAETAAAVGLCAVWVVANLLELAGKLVVARDPIADAFRHSYPSGHTVRACVAAAAVAAVWRRVHVVVAVWAIAVVPVALVLLGDHTPTDVVGGLLLAALLLGAAATALHAEAEPRRTSLQRTHSPPRVRRGPLP